MNGIGSSLDSHGTAVTSLNGLPLCLNEEIMIAGIGDGPNKIFKFQQCCNLLP